ncbi:hypothetical protein LTR95_003582 [Oleoguttula sp. CCFEE 5521]
MTSEYGLTPDQECIDHYGGHAHQPSYSSNATNEPLRRDGSIAHQPLSSYSYPANGNGVGPRYLPERHDAHRVSLRMGRTPPTSLRPQFGEPARMAATSTHPSAVGLAARTLSARAAQPYLHIKRTPHRLHTAPTRPATWYTYREVGNAQLRLCDA